MPPPKDSAADPGTPNRISALRALVSGHVQGVGFRYYARREAQRLGLRGWVRNLDDGDVEVWAEGSCASLAEFRTWLQEGPPGSWVASVEARSVEPTGSFAGFEALP